jgi:DNA repair protein RadC
MGALLPGGDRVYAARMLLARFGGISEVINASPTDIMNIAGIDVRAATGISVFRAVTERCLKRAAEKEDTTAQSERLVDLWRFRIGGLRREVFEVGYLDSSYRLLVDGVERIEEGTVDRAAVYPRQVIAAALRREAFGLVLAHNHPNARVEPTEHDKLLTRALVLAADTVDVRVVDHLIVSSTAVFSFKAAGLL